MKEEGSVGWTMADSHFIPLVWNYMPLSPTSLFVIPTFVLRSEFDQMPVPEVYLPSNDSSD